MNKLIVLLIFTLTKFIFQNSCSAQIQNNCIYNDTLISYYLLDDIHKIASENTIYTTTAGFAANENGYFLPFKNVKDLSSIKDLQYLIYHPCPAVRCCAIYGLVNKKSDSIFSALEYLSKDTASFKNKFLGYNPTLKVVDYIYRDTNPRVLEEEYGYKLSLARKKQLRIIRRKMKKLLSKFE